jgi:hypothetical protein
MLDIINQLLYSFKNDFEITYIGIGTFPYGVQHLEEFNDDKNQLFPLFLRKQSTKSIRIIHFDNGFEYNSFEFVYKYLKFMKLNQFITNNNFEIWKNKNIEFIIVPINITEEERYEICSHISLRTFKTNNKVIVQEFSGRELVPSFRKFVKENYEKIEDIRKNVIWDLTYGQDCNCMTKISEYPKYYAEDGNIFNLWTYKHKEIVNLITKTKEYNPLILNIFLKYYKDIIRTHHVNYRRSIMGLCHLYQTNMYPLDSTPRKIMDYLIGEIETVMYALQMLTNKSQEEMDEFTKKMISYERYDPHKWYSDMLLYFG